MNLKDTETGSVNAIKRGLSKSIICPGEKTHTILWDLKMQTDYLIPTKRQDLLIINRKKKEKKKRKKSEPLKQ